MRPAIRTKRQARQRLVVAKNALGDVYLAIQRQREKKLLPNIAAHHVFLGISHVRAALAELNHANDGQ